MKDDMNDDAREDEYAVQWTPAKVTTLCACIFLMALCVTLPLVGPSAYRTPHYWPQNVLTFLAVLFPGGFFSALGLVLARKERKTGMNTNPRLPMTFLLAHLFFFITFLSGGFRI